MVKSGGDSYNDGTNQYEERVEWMDARNFCMWPSLNPMADMCTTYDVQKLLVNNLRQYEAYRQSFCRMRADVVIRSMQSKLIREAPYNADLKNKTAKDLVDAEEIVEGMGRLSVVMVTVDLLETAAIERYFEKSSNLSRCLLMPLAINAHGNTKDVQTVVERMLLHRGKSEDASAASRRMDSIRTSHQLQKLFCDFELVFYGSRPHWKEGISFTPCLGDRHRNRQAAGSTAAVSPAREIRGGGSGVRGDMVGVISRNRGHWFLRGNILVLRWFSRDLDVETLTWNTVQRVPLTFNDRSDMAFFYTSNCFPLKRVPPRAKRQIVPRRRPKRLQITNHVRSDSSDSEGAEKGVGVRVKRKAGPAKAETGASKRKRRKKGSGAFGMGKSKPAAVAAAESVEFLADLADDSVAAAAPGASTSVWDNPEQYGDGVKKKKRVRGRKGKKRVKVEAPPKNPDIFNVEDWIPVQDPRGRTYYYHRVTKQTRWEDSMDRYLRREKSELDAAMPKGNIGPTIPEHILEEKKTKPQRRLLSEAHQVVEEREFISTFQGKEDGEMDDDLGDGSGGGVIDPKQQQQLHANAATELPPAPWKDQYGIWHHPGPTPPPRTSMATMGGPPAGPGQWGSGPPPPVQWGNGLQQPLQQPPPGMGFDMSGPPPSHLPPGMGFNMNQPHPQTGQPPHLLGMGGGAPPFGLDGKGGKGKGGDTFAHPTMVGDRMWKGDEPPPQIPLHRQGPFPSKGKGGGPPEGFFDPHAPHDPFRMQMRPPVPLGPQPPLGPSVGGSFQQHLPPTRLPGPGMHRPPGSSQEQDLEFLFNGGGPGVAGPPLGPGVQPGFLGPSPGPGGGGGAPFPANNSYALQRQIGFGTMRRGPGGAQMVDSWDGPPPPPHNHNVEFDPRARDDDWSCPNVNCRMLVFARYRRCQKCGEEMPEYEKKWRKEAAQAAGSTGCAFKSATPEACLSQRPP
jgi:hypothetical protein